MTDSACASPGHRDDRSALRGYKTFPGHIDQVAEARSFLRRLLKGFPLTDEAVLVASELCANAALHSRSSDFNGWFGVRAEIHPGDFLWLEVEDLGGEWHECPAGDDRPHGLDILRSIVGDDNWGVDGDSVSGHVVWLRLDWPAADGQ